MRALFTQDIVSVVFQRQRELQKQGGERDVRGRGSNSVGKIEKEIEREERKGKQWTLSCHLEK